MGFRLENEDIKKLPKHVQKQIFKLNPELKAELFDIKWTGIRPVGFEEFEIVIKDKVLVNYTVRQFEEEVNPKIIDVWKQYLRYCMYHGGKYTKPLPLPPDIERKIFELHDLEEVYDMYKKEEKKELKEWVELMSL